MRDTQYFKASEFACKCGCGSNGMVQDFVDHLCIARRLAGVPFHISSGFRCDNHNRSVGGVKDSAHIEGLACDIAVSDGPSRFKIVRALIDAGFDRIGIGLSLVHVDADTVKPKGVIWTYGNK